MFCTEHSASTPRPDRRCHSRLVCGHLHSTRRLRASRLRQKDGAELVALGPARRSPDLKKKREGKQTVNQRSNAGERQSQQMVASVIQDHVTIVPIESSRSGEDLWDLSRVRCVAIHRMSEVWDVAAMQENRQAFILILFGTSVILAAESERTHCGPHGLNSTSTCHWRILHWSRRRDVKARGVGLAGDADAPPVEKRRAPDQPQLRREVRQCQMCLRAAWVHLATAVPKEQPPPVWRRRCGSMLWDFHISDGHTAHLSLERPEPDAEPDAGAM